MKLIPDLESVAAGVKLSKQVKYKNQRNIVQVELKIFYPIMIPPWISNGPSLGYV